MILKIPLVQESDYSTLNRYAARKSSAVITRITWRGSPVAAPHCGKSGRKPNLSV